MKQTERLMAMTTHDNCMSFEKATFAHLYMNREFLSQEFACGKMVFGELVCVFNSETEGKFITELITAIRTSASEEEARHKICCEYGLCSDTATYLLALPLDELTSLSQQKCQEALSYFEVMSSVSMSE
jgi:hypothetical protein